MSYSLESSTESNVAHIHWLPPTIITAYDWETNPLSRRTDTHYTDSGTIVMGPDSIDHPAAAISLIIPPFTRLKSLSEARQNPQIADWRIATWLAETPGSLEGIIKTEPDRYRNLSLFEAHSRLDTIGYASLSRLGAKVLNSWSQHCFKKDLFTVAMYIMTSLDQPETPELKELGRLNSVVKARQWLKDANDAWGSKWITRTIGAHLIEVIEKYPQYKNINVT